MRQEFTATVIDTRIEGDQEFFGYADTDMFDIEFTKTTAIVEYHIDLQLKKWGIESIHVFIDKITCPVEWYVSSADECTPEEIAKLISYGGIEEMNGDISGRFEIDTTKPLKGNAWEISNEVEFQKDGGFSISEITINLRDASIEIH